MLSYGNDPFSSLSFSSQGPNVGHSPVPFGIGTKGGRSAQLATGVAFSDHALCSCFDAVDLAGHRLCQRHIRRQYTGSGVELGGKTFLTLCNRCSS